LTSLTTLLAIIKPISRPNSAAIQDIDIDIADILGQKYRYRIDIGHCDIDPPLTGMHFYIPYIPRPTSCIMHECVAAP